MNELRTVLTANAVEPKMRISDLSQATSYTSAVTPDAKNRQAISGKASWEALGGFTERGWGTVVLAGRGRRDGPLLS
jgi:hypothetical protein